MTRHDLFRRAAAPVVLAAAALAAAAPPLHGQSTPPEALQEAAGEAAVMPLEDVRIGMKGYGLTVFHGTKIEPFPVEVVSVVSNFNPKRGTVWIRSDHPVLNVSGPVQGMSGSPIYLWEEGEEGELGQGGKLVGAFAYGFPFVKECLAGVQPISYMETVGTEIDRNPDDGEEPEARSGTNGSLRGALAALDRLRAAAAARGEGGTDTLRLDATYAALTRVAQAHGIRRGEPAHPPARLPAAPEIDGVQAQARPLLLPMTMPSAELAEFASPILEPLGIQTVAGNAIAGPPPAGIDAENTKLAPGSVLSIPLAFGDSDISAAGTVTGVRPDGTVLAFGHAMFGQGEVALPMATGYVHFFVPRLNISFKQAGSLQIVGSVVQDQNAAVAGLIGETRYELAPLTVDVRMPGREEERYEYQMVNHPDLTPVLASSLAMQSVVAIQELPQEHTIKVTGEMTFSGGRTLNVDTLASGGGINEIGYELLPALMVMMSNPHENLNLEMASFDVEVEPVLRVGTLIDARVERAEVAPGDTLRVYATVQPYAEDVQIYAADLDVPEGTPEGDYPLMVMDAAQYAAMWAQTRPHLFSTASVDDVTELVQDLLDIRKDALYLVLQLPQEGLAVGRVELPRLPSSRRAILAVPTSTAAVPFPDTAEAVVPTDVVVSGQLAFTISVRKDPAARLQPAGN